MSIVARFARWQWTWYILSVLFGIHAIALFIQGNSPIAATAWAVICLLIIRIQQLETDRRDLAVGLLAVMRALGMVEQEGDR